MSEEWPPQWLKDCAVGLPEEVRYSLPSIAQHPDPVAGDVRWIVDPEGRLKRRLGLVLLVFDGEEAAGGRALAHVALVSAEAEMAADRDFILMPGETGLPFEVVVETDVVCPVWLEQLGDAVAQLPAELAFYLDDASLSPEEFPLPLAASGVPIWGEVDPRLAWKAEEAATLEALAADCLAAVWAEERSPEAEEATSIRDLVLSWWRQPVDPAGNFGRRVQAMIDSLEAAFAPESLVGFAFVSTGARGAARSGQEVEPLRLSAVRQLRRQLWAPEAEPTLELLPVERGGPHDSLALVRLRGELPPEAALDLVVGWGTATACALKTTRMERLPEHDDDDGYVYGTVVILPEEVSYLALAWEDVL